MKRNDFSVANTGAHFKVEFTADLSAFQNYENFLYVQRNLNTLVFISLFNKIRKSCILLDNLNIRNSG